MTDAPTNATVLNTTVLSNFAQVGHVELLLDLPRLITVKAVREELEAGVETHPYTEHALSVLGAEIPVIVPSGAAQQSEEQLLESLDSGEAQALAVAEAEDGTLITDDGDARSIAEQRGVELTGSIGVLVRVVKHGHITAEAVDEYLKR